VIWRQASKFLPFILPQDCTEKWVPPNLQVKLPSKMVESYTKFQPVSLSQSTLKYGEFKDTAPFAREPVRLHYENNSPFVVATKMTREVEISHWGNAYVEEYYMIQHTGAKLRVRSPRWDWKGGRQGPDGSWRGRRQALPRWSVL